MLVCLTNRPKKCGQLYPMSTERDSIKRERNAIKRKYGELFSAVTAALFEDDPIGINFESNADEYEPEAGIIIPKLHSATSAEDVETIVYEEFSRWFGAGDAGPKSRYESVSRQIWELWCASQKPAQL
jgi:hypothetical protein